MKILERKEISVIGTCPHCCSILQLDKEDIYWSRDIDGGTSPWVKCAVCGKGFDVEGWKNINKLY